MTTIPEAIDVGLGDNGKTILYDDVNSYEVQGLSNDQVLFVNSSNEIISKTNEELNLVETASNVGSGQSVFKQKVGTNLEFRRIDDDGTLNITQNVDSIQFGVNINDLGTGASELWSANKIQSELNSIPSGSVNFQEISNTNTFSFNSTSFVIVPSITTTLSIGEHYLVISGYYGLSPSFRDVEFGIFRNGILIDTTFRDYDTFSGFRHSLNTHVVINSVNASDVYDLRGRVSVSSTTASVFTVSLVIISK